MADHRACGCAGKTPVSDQRNTASKLLVAADRLGGIKHFRHPRCLRPLIADKYRIALLHLMLQNGFQALLLTVKGSCPKDCPEHLLRAGCMLDHRSLGRQVSFQNGNASVCPYGLIVGPDNVFSGEIYMITAVKVLQTFFAALIKAVLLQLLQIFSQSLSGNRHDIQMQMILDLLHDRRNAARVIEHFRRPSPRRTHIQKIARASVKPVKGIACDFDAELMGNGRNVEQAVGASGNGRMHQDCVFKALLRDNILRTHPLHIGKAYRLLPRLIGECEKIRTCSRHQRTSRERQPQGLRHNLHSGCRADKGACAAAWTGVAFCPV